MHFLPMAAASDSAERLKQYVQLWSAQKLATSGVVLDRTAFRCVTALFRCVHVLQVPVQGQQLPGLRSPL
jgi:hypothetical protein